MRTAVILAGGGGTRLWPASRRSRPKQFLALGTDTEQSLLTSTAERLRPVCGESIVVVTARDQAATVRNDLPTLGDDAIIAEPAARNTAAALGLAAVHLVHRDADAIMGVIPADQTVADGQRFAEVVTQAFDIAASRDVIVTIGIVPTRPETGYGYLEVGPQAEDGSRVVERFVEKPDAETAERYLAAGNYLWNGGMFFARATRLLADIEAYMPETHTALAAIAEALAESSDAANRVTEELYPSVPKISIDYGVMEKTAQVVTLAGDFGWNDVGSWSALADYRAADAAGNITQGNVVTVDAKSNIIIGDEGTAVAIVGVDNLVVVQSGDAVLVVPRERAQDVRDAVDALRNNDLERFL